MRLAKATLLVGIVTILTMWSPVESLAEGVYVITLHRHREHWVAGEFTPDRNDDRVSIESSARAEYEGAPGADLGRDGSLGTGVKERNDTWNYGNQGKSVNGRVRAEHVLNCPEFSCGGRSGALHPCAAANLPMQYEQKTVVTIIRPLPSPGNFQEKEHTFHFSDQCRPYQPPDDPGGEHEQAPETGGSGGSGPAPPCDETLGTGEEAPTVDLPG